MSTKGVAHAKPATPDQSVHSVSLAHDGNTALRLAQADPPDTVLLDLGLPGITGFDVARRMRGMPALAHTRIRD